MMEAQYKISAVYFPHPSELELTWEDIQTGEHASLCVKVTKEQGEAVSKVVPPCSYIPACVNEKPATVFQRCEAADLLRKIISLIESEIFPFI